MYYNNVMCFVFFSSRRRHTRYWRDWSSDVCSSDLEDSIRTGEYLLSRPLFIYVSTDALEDNKAVKPFVDFYLSRQNLDRLVMAPKYVTMPASLEEESRAQYEDRTTGTVFTEEGEPKGGDLEAALKGSQ